MGVRVPLRAQMFRLLRWCTVGVASYLAWAAVNVLIIVSFPFLSLIVAVDRRRGSTLFRRGCAAFLRGFFLGYLSWIRLHRIAAFPPRGSVTRGRCVFVANHRSWLDPLLALALFPGVRLPVNEAYTKVPLMGPLMRWMGCIPLRRDDPAKLAYALAECRRALAAGEPLFVFPEARRTRGPGLGIFNDVFFRLAIGENAEVVPVVLHSDVPFLAPPGGSWLTEKRASWTIRALDPLPRDRRDAPSDLGRLARKAIARELAKLEGPAAPT